MTSRSPFEVVLDVAVAVLCVLAYAASAQCLRAYWLMSTNQSGFPPGALSFGAALRITQFLERNPLDVLLQAALFAFVAARPIRVRFVALLAAVFVPVVAHVVIHGSASGSLDRRHAILEAMGSGVIASLLWALYRAVLRQWKSRS